MNVVPFYEGRDYVLFAKLAGVRDYWNEIQKLIIHVDCQITFLI